MSLKYLNVMPQKLCDVGMIATWSNCCRFLRGLTGQRCSSSSTSSSPSSSDHTTNSSNTTNYAVNQEFINRNPRNLEQMGLARKRKGWKFQYPPQDFYHRVIFEKSTRHVSARVEHCSGKTILTASTQEFALAKGLYSLSDAAAAENVGHVLAQRCQEAGITCMKILTPEISGMSEKFQSFISALEEGGIEFDEPEEFIPPYEPGIDFDNEYELEDLKRRQKLASRPVSFYTRYGKARRVHRGNRAGRSVV